MLRKLWARRGPKVIAEERADSPSRSVDNRTETTHSRSEELSRSKNQQPSDTQPDGGDSLASFTNPNLGFSFTGTTAAEDIPSILLDDQLFGPFTPSVENIGNGLVYNNTGEQLLVDLPLVDIGLAGYQEIPWNIDAYLT